MLTSDDFIAHIVFSRQTNCVWSVITIYGLTYLLYVGIIIISHIISNAILFINAISPIYATQNNTLISISRSEKILVKKLPHLKKRKSVVKLTTLSLANKPQKHLSVNHFPTCRGPLTLTISVASSVSLIIHFSSTISQLNLIYLSTTFQVVVTFYSPYPLSSTKKVYKINYIVNQIVNHNYHYHLPN